MRAPGLVCVVLAISGCSMELIDDPGDSGPEVDAGTAADAGTWVDAGFDAGPALFNAAEYVSQTIPTSVVAGATFQVSVTMRNIGTTSWALGAQGHYLGSEGPMDNLVWGTTRVFMAQGVTTAPGGSYTFTGPVTAPSTPGMYPMKWQMLQNEVEWFGAMTPTLTISVTQSGAPPGSTPEQIIAFHRNMYGTPMTEAEVVAALRAIAIDLNAHGVPGGPFGILVKTAGSMCNGYSCDIICSGQGGQQRQWDVFVDSGPTGTSNPVWREVGQPVTQRPCEFP